VAIIDIEDIYFSYRDGTEALRGLSLSVEKGQRVALLGPNGAGKSTLLLHLNGINLPRGGRVSVLGREINKKTEKWVRSMVGMVFQDPDDQVFSSTVWEDVSFGPKNMGLPQQEVESRAKDALEAVGMSGYEKKAPYHLSYGQKKRVAIAGVLAMLPEIVVLDEPMAFLDPRGKDTLEEILNRMHSRGQTIIIATHDVDFAVEWADRVIIIKDGRTLAQGGRDLLREPDLVDQAQLRLPVVSRIFLRVPQLGINPLPQTIAEAARAIAGLDRGAGAGPWKGLIGMTGVNREEPLIWLEPDHLHYHQGVVQVKALWGKMMRREGGADVSDWTGHAVDPGGNVLDADIGPGGDDFHRMAFFAAEEGLYGLVLESGAVTGGERHLRRARMPVPVGHDVQGSPGGAGPAGLDLYCEKYLDYGLGKTVTLKVTLDGRPLPGAVVKATYHFFEGDDYPWTGETGQDGRVACTFFEKGHWLFTCTHSDAGAVYTACYTIPGVR
jgi:cobalt/nickel transport system ATP-binding protein